MIFDFLTGLFAIGNAAIEAAAVAAAINGGNHSQTSFVAPEKPCFEEEQVKEKKKGYSIGHYVSAVEAKNEYNRRLRERKMREAQEQGNENPLDVNDSPKIISSSTNLFAEERYTSNNEYDYDQYDDASEEDDDNFWYEEEERERLRQEEEDWYDEQERLREEEEAERAYQERLEEIEDRYPGYNYDLIPDGADLDDVERDARIDDYLMNW